MRKIITVSMLFIMVLMNNNVSAQCGTPAGLSAAYSTPSMNLTWNVVPGALSYAINIQNSSGNNVLFNATFNSTTNSFSISGLTMNANYKFKVRSRCASGHGNWSPYFNFIFGGSGTGTGCGVVNGVTVTATTATSASFSWNPVQGASGYRVRIENGSGNPVAFATVNTVSGTTFTKSGLTASTNYKVKVRALCGGNLGGWSSWVPFSTTALRLADENIFQRPEISLAPNPAADVTRINYSGAIEADKFFVIITDMTGRTIFTDEYSVDADDYILYTNNMDAGQYILTVRNGSQSANSRLLVVH